MSKELELWNTYGKTQKEENVTLGPHFSYEFRNSRRQLLFTAARYKFAMKILAGGGIKNKLDVLDLGCSDGFGTHFLGECTKKLVGVDFDEEAIHFAKLEKSLDYINFIYEDFFQKNYGKFDGVVSFDVIEHIYPENIGIYMNTVLDNLNDKGVFIVGSPSLESQKYSKENIANAHVNVYTGEDLGEMLEQYFSNVFMFTQNDEIIHTGHFRMANYLIAVCCGKKEDRNGKE